MKYPEAKPRIISDNGPQFIVKYFQEFIWISGMSHVRTSLDYPQVNGKMERFHKTIKTECLRLTVSLFIDTARIIVGKYIVNHNLHPKGISFVRADELLNSALVTLHNAIGYDNRL